MDLRVRSSLALAFTEADVRRLETALPRQQKQPGYAVRWLDIAEARRVEPRISDETLGATLIEGGGAVVAQGGSRDRVIERSWATKSGAGGSFVQRSSAD